jgi:undecaprenyl-diphosphatase
LNLLLSLNQFISQLNIGFIDKFFTEYLTYSLPIILLVLWFWNSSTKKVALRGLFSAILAWPIFSVIIGKLVDRPRPFSISGVQELVFHRPDYSFPSEHAAALFAVALSFYFSGYKKLGHVMLAIAILVSFFRIASGLHYPTDVLGGIAIGVISSWIIKTAEPYLSPIYDFIINIAKKIKLA